MFPSPQVNRQARPDLDDRPAPLPGDKPRFFMRWFVPGVRGVADVLLTLV